MKNTFLAVSCTAISLFLITSTALRQHLLKFDLTGSTILEHATNDFGTDINVIYKQKVIHIKNSLSLFGSVSSFYQPKSFEGSYSYATDVAEYDRYRYGFAAGTGFTLEGSVLDVELGASFSRHYVQLNKSSGDLPPSSGSFTPAPEEKFRSYSMLGSILSLGYDISRSFLISASAGIHSSISNSSDTLVFRPSIGLGYNF